MHKTVLPQTHTDTHRQKTSMSVCVCVGLWLILLLILAPVSALSQESKLDAGLDDVISGFEETKESVDEAPNLDELLTGFGTDEDVIEGVTAEKPVVSKSDNKYIPNWLELSGSLSLALSFNYAHHAPAPGATDFRKLSRLKSTLDLDADFKLSDNWRARVGGQVFYDAIYSLEGRHNYTSKLLDNYEDEIELTEVYLQGELFDNFDIKVGRQVVVWGKSDNIRITDILNPLDNREPGLVDIKDLRLPVTMTRMDYYFGQWNLCGMLIHEIKFNKDPVFGSDFFPGDRPLPREEKPSSTWNNQEYALALNGIFNNWDLSLYGAWLWDDRTYQEYTPTGPQLSHSRILMLGLAVNIAYGNWLLKGEAAYLDGLKYISTIDRKNRLDLLLGLEYTGFNETVISLEIANRHIFSFDQRLQPAPIYGKENEFQSVLRLTRDFRHDTLQLTLLLSTFGLTGDEGSLQRVTIAYDISDNLKLTGGIIAYQNGKKALFRKIGDNDRFFTELRYSF